MPKEEPKAVDLSPKSLMPKGIRPNYATKQIAQTMKGANVQIHYKSNAGLRSAQNQAIKMFIEEQKVNLFLLARRGEITERDKIAQEGALSRIRDRMIQTMAEWAGEMHPKHGAVGTGLSREFESACHRVFNQFRDELGVPIKVSNIPIGPVSRHKAEKKEEIVVAPVDLKLSDLKAVEQSMDSGPLNEQSVLEVGLQQPELPVFDPEEDK